MLVHADPAAGRRGQGRGRDRVEPRLQVPLEPLGPWVRHRSRHHCHDRPRAGEETKVTYFDFLSFLESSQSCGAKGDKDRPDQDRQPAGRRRLTCS